LFQFTQDEYWWENCVRQISHRKRYFSIKSRFSIKKTAIHISKFIQCGYLGRRGDDRKFETNKKSFPRRIQEFHEPKTVAEYIIDPLIVSFFMYFPFIYTRQILMRSDTILSNHYNLLNRNLQRL